MARLTILAGMLALCLSACGAAGRAEHTSGEKPMRIVSLDYCADQYVLKLADAEQILAISPAATGDFSYMREAARGVPTVRSSAEDVLVLQPDLVVRSYGGGPRAEAFFERAGIPVLNVGWTSSIRGDGPTSIAGVIQHMADGLGQSKKGRRLVADFQNRLDAIDAGNGDKTALYMASGGVTSGPGSLVHEMIEAAGLKNFQTEPGWHSIPLERLTREEPDVVVPALFNSRDGWTPDRWSPTHHPIAQKQLARQSVVPVEGAWTACGAWFLMDAVEALAEGAGK